MVKEGELISYDDLKGRKCIGIVTGKRKGYPVKNTRTGVINRNTIQIRIQPDDGTSAFWTPTIEEH